VFFEKNLPLMRGAIQNVYFHGGNCRYEIAVSFRITAILRTAARNRF
jgi:hypothetical protein